MNFQEAQKIGRTEGAVEAWEAIRQGTKLLQKVLVRKARSMPASLMDLQTINTCEVAPKDRPKHRPRGVVIQATTLPKNNSSGIVGLDTSLSSQNVHSIATPRIKWDTPSQQTSLRKCSSTLGQEHLSNRDARRKSQRVLTSTNLRSLRHPNIDTTWLLDAEIGSGYEVTFSSDIPLNIFLQGGQRPSDQRVECYFKDLIRGINHLHSNGIAHRNFCPENLLLAAGGTLKIAGFTCAESFRVVGKASTKIRLSSTKCGSPSYLGPEALVDYQFDPRPVDMWALAVVYVEMRTGKLLWNLAAQGADEYYDQYLQDRKGLWGYRPIENLEDESCREIIRSLLELNPLRCQSASQITKSGWIAKGGYLTSM
ncbi:kinase-like protein [Hyaloscypha variabilis]